MYYRTSSVTLSTVEMVLGRQSTVSILTRAFVAGVHASMFWPKLHVSPGQRQLAGVQPFDVVHTFSSTVRTTTIAQTVGTIGLYQRVPLVARWESGQTLENLFAWRGEKYWNG
jgi:hypothetical protein